MTTTNKNEMEILCDMFDTCKDHNDTITMDNILHNMDFKSLTVGGIMAVMRTTYEWRDTIPCWRTRLGEAYRELDNRGQDAQQILRGLF